MKKLRYSVQFRKDFKRYRHLPRKIEALNAVLNLLAADKPIPAEYYPHPLTGRYHGCLECHVGSDFLLVWKDEANDIVYLVRLGSHSELFD